MLANLAKDSKQAGKGTNHPDYKSLADKLEKEIFDNLVAFGDFVSANPSN